MRAMKIRSTKTGRWSSKNPNLSGKPGVVGMTNPCAKPIAFYGLSVVQEELVEHPIPRRREAIEHTRRKLGL